VNYSRVNAIVKSRMSIVTRVFSVRYLSEAKGGSEPHRFEDNGDSRQKEIFRKVSLLSPTCVLTNVYIPTSSYYFYWPCKHDA